MNETPQRRVVCAAIRTEGGEIILGARHYDALMRRTYAMALPPSYTGFKTAKQGFIDQWCKFMDREEAWKVAEAAGQIIRDCGTVGTLYSENLY